MKTCNSAVLGSSATKSFPVRGKTFKGVSLSFIGKRMSQDDHGTIKPKQNRNQTVCLEDVEADGGLYLDIKIRVEGYPMFV